MEDVQMGDYLLLSRGPSYPLRFDTLCCFPTSDARPSPILGEASPSIHPGPARIGGWGQPGAQLTMLSGPGVAPTGLGSLLCFFKYL